MNGKNRCKQVLNKAFQVFLLEMQAKRELLFNLNDNKTSRTLVYLLWPMHVSPNVFNVPLRWFALIKVYWCLGWSWKNSFEAIECFT